MAKKPSKVTTIAVLFTTVSSVPACGQVSARSQDAESQKKEQNAGASPPAETKLTERVPIINHVIDMFEGTKFVNDKHDKGGATKFGITQAALTDFRGKSVTVKDVREMQRAEAVTIYTKNYWDKMRCDEMPQELRCIAFDMAVNHGSKNATTILQKALNKVDKEDQLKVDGKIGPVTLVAAKEKMERLGAKPVLRLVVEERKEFYENIIKRNSSQEKFRKGWMNRASWFIENMDRMIPDEPKEKPEQKAPQNKPAKEIAKAGQQMMLPFA